MHLAILATLALGCLAIVVAIPLEAHRGKLHIPGYSGIAMLAFGASLVCGLLSGSRHLFGSPLGIVLSLFCFWLAAACVGSILALFFYRAPPEAEPVR